MKTLQQIKAELEAQLAAVDAEIAKEEKAKEKESKKDDNWLENLKAGDQVIVMGSTYGDKIRTVKRTTKAHIIFEETSVKFRKTTGASVTKNTWDYRVIDSMA